MALRGGGFVGGDGFLGAVSERETRRASVGWLVDVFERLDIEMGYLAALYGDCVWESGRPSIDI